MKTNKRFFSFFYDFLSKVMSLKLQNLTLELFIKDVINMNIFF